MGDSDEEYDRRRSRDKFAKERSNGMDRRDYRGGSSYGGRTDYRSRPRDPPSSQPPPKRSRRDWGEDTYDPQPRTESSSGPPAPPVLMSFKQFLATQDDSISDDDAISKYQDYKLEFKRQQLHAFFIQHKDEEWFKVKYHPEDSVKAREEALGRVQRRLELFEELSEKGLIDLASLEANNEYNIVRLLDALVVKLEDGTDEDVEGLGAAQDVPPPPCPGKKKLTRSTSSTSSPEKKKVKVKSSEPKEDGEENSDGEEEEETKPEVKEEEEAEVKESNGNGEKKDEDGALSDHEEQSEGLDLSEDRGDGGEDGGKSEKKPVEAPSEPTTLLHKTASIFLRNIAPAITKAEVEQLCQRYQGFLRVGLAEPLADRRYYRRGWVSFKRDVNIKDIAWNMGSVRLRDCDLGPIVNRDLTRRVRTVNGLTAHKAVAQNDLRLAAKLVQAYDKRWGLYQPKEESKPEPEPDAEEAQPPIVEVSRGMESGNPLLSNITDYLIEEASAEEEELLGEDADGHNAASTPYERDSELIKVLDRIILYLRLVHSVDFYNAGEYPHEDEMPNRCGLVHVRGPPPADGLVPPNFSTEFCKTFEGKVIPLLNQGDKVSEDELAKLGKKDPEKEVEAFITANTQELAKDKWLCPLSGKKFKGPEFIRKHVQNKHGEKLDEVRVEVVYFNNYLMDAKRPGAQDPPKPPASTSSTNPDRSSSYSSSAQGYDGGSRYPPFQSPETRPPSLVNSDFRGPPGFGGGGYGGYGRGRFGGGGGYGGGAPPPQPPRRDFGAPLPRAYQAPPFGRPYDGKRDPREPITYKDLDAPDDNY